MQPEIIMPQPIYIQSQNQSSPIEGHLCSHQTSFSHVQNVQPIYIIGNSASPIQIIDQNQSVLNVDTQIQRRVLGPVTNAIPIGFKKYVI